MAKAFNTAWNISGISQYEIKQFPLPFSSVPKNEMTSYQPFLRSDHVPFWGYQVSAILLTDTGNVYAKLNIQMDIDWLNCMKKNVLCFYDTSSLLNLSMTFYNNDM